MKERGENLIFGKEAKQAKDANEVRLHKLPDGQMFAHLFLRLRVEANLGALIRVDSATVSGHQDLGIRLMGSREGDLDEVFPARIQELRVEVADPWQQRVGHGGGGDEYEL